MSSTAEDAATVPKPVEDAPSFGGLNKSFLMVYRIFAILSTAAFAAYVLITLIDIVTYEYKETRQRVNLVLDPNMMNANSTDVSAMEYLNNNPDTEPFNIFLGQRMVSGIFIITGLAILLLGLHIAVFFGLKIYSLIKKREFNESVDIPMEYMGLLLLCYIAALVVNAIYKAKFLKGTQPTMRDVRARMREVKSFIYTNMITDSAFLAALTTDDMDRVTSMMKSTRTQANLVKMMFTVNMYMFFTTQVPESDKDYDKVKSMFSLDTIRKQSHDPSMFFVYRKAPFVPNLYPSMKEDLVLGSREAGFVRDIGRRMKELNKRLVRLQNINDGKLSMRGYLWTTFSAAWVLMAVVVIMLMFIFMKPMFMRIVEAVITAFSRKNKVVPQ